jgi:hypothetical protein
MSPPTSGVLECVGCCVECRSSKGVRLRPGLAPGCVCVVPVWRSKQGIKGPANGDVASLGQRTMLGVEVQWQGVGEGQAEDGSSE